MVFELKAHPLAALFPRMSEAALSRDGVAVAP